MKHLYVLERYRGRASRYNCPHCGKHKTFTRYINTQTGEHLHPDAGRCNREVSCGYHLPPKQFFENNKAYNPMPHKPRYGSSGPLKMPAAAHATTIPDDIFKGSLAGYASNNFMLFLTERFGAEKAQQLAATYHIGTSKHWKGATVFWQVDAQGKAQAGKIMLYNPANGKRVKEPFNHITWVHKVAHLREGVTPRQCLFGAHLLAGNNLPIALVESEKTAIIASAYLPQYLWLATGSLSNLNIEKCRVLQGRRVFLYPDLNGFDKWSAKAKELAGTVNCKVAAWLQHHAGETEKQQGFDIADYLLQFSLEEFAALGTTTKPDEKPDRFIGDNACKPARFNTCTIDNPDKLNQAITQLANRFDCTIEATCRFNHYTPQPTPAELFAMKCANRLTELETFFASVTLPTHPIKPNAWTTIQDVAKNVESELYAANAKKGNRPYVLHLERLEELKGWLDLQVIR